ncbi:MAG: cation-transporting P-type ATPase [Candidatus Woesearchaeota archaeon]
MYNGLSNEKAKELLNTFGPNEIETKKKNTAITILLNQFKSIIPWILIFALVLSAISNKIAESIVILIIILVVILLGFIQEYRANKAIESLRKLLNPKCKVYRNGNLIEIDARDLVPGDLIYLEEGDRIPADCIILSEKELRVDESVLTGESIPVKKIVSDNAEKVLSLIQNNMFDFSVEPELFMGTFVKSGNCEAIVVKTGKNTEFGKIAKSIKEDKIVILNKHISHIVKLLITIAFVSCFILITSFIINQGFSYQKLIEIIEISIAFLVASIPEGLPIVVTLSLALAMRRLYRKKVLVKRLSVIEALGCVNVICTDKTGTITKNQLTVVKTFNENKIMHLIMCACNSAKLKKEENSERWSGDAVDVALKEYSVAKFNESFSIIDIIPFKSENGYMKALVEFDGKRYEIVKGNPTLLLENSKHLMNGISSKEEVLATIETFSDEALRVIGFCYRETTEHKLKEELTGNYIFVGLAGMIDPIKEDVKEAIETVQGGGIEVKMITGDYAKTAYSIAKQAGIKNLEIFTWDRELDDASKYGIFARTKPLKKLEIVKSLKEKDYIVAMTGDGVNDAPALSEADIGIAVGSGTEVAKESADMILIDNSFSAFRDAVKEARLVFANTRKYISYLFICKILEIGFLLIPTILGFPTPLTALQILFFNLFSDDITSINLSLSNFTENTMNLKPIKRNEPLITKKYIIIILTLGLYLLCLNLLLFFYMAHQNSSIERIRTVAFVTITMSEIFCAFVFVELHRTTFVSFLSNKKLLVGAIVALIGSLIAIYFEPLAKILGNAWIDPKEILFISLITSSIFLVGDLTKWIISKKIDKKPFLFFNKEL